MVKILKFNKATRYQLCCQGRMNKWDEIVFMWEEYTILSIVFFNIYTNKKSI